MENHLVNSVKKIANGKHKKRLGEEGVKIGPNEYLTKIRDPITFKELEILVRYDPVTGRRIPPP